MGKLPLTKANIRKMAQERALNAMQEDLESFGFLKWLTEQGYSAQETLQIEQAYAAVIIEAQAKLDGSSRDEARIKIMKRYESMGDTE